MSKNSISYWLPHWIISSTKGRKCSKCNTKFSRNDIIAVGVRQNGKSVATYIEHECNSCKYRGMIVLGKDKEDTLEKMCYVLLESIKQRKMAEKSAKLREKKEGKMTDCEINKMINFIKGAKTHEDLLRQMGVSPKTKQDDQD